MDNEQEPKLRELASSGDGLGLADDSGDLEKDPASAPENTADIEVGNRSNITSEHDHDSSSPNSNDTAKSEDSLPSDTQASRLEEAGNQKQIEPLEIESQEVNGDQVKADESFESVDDNDMRHLLENTDDSRAPKDSSSNQQRKPLVCGVCSKPERVGNMLVFLPSVFSRSGWGIAGPHWFGPICVLLLLSFASHYFIKISTKHIGPITTAICILWTLATTYHLGNVAYRDPGVVKLQRASQRPENDVSDEDRRLQFRWCDRCQVYQPVDGAHCSDCNVCVAGFDQ